jgi:hypothetical protein
MADSKYNQLKSILKAAVPGTATGAGKVTMEEADVRGAEQAIDALEAQLAKMKTDLQTAQSVLPAAASVVDWKNSDSVKAFCAAAATHYVDQRQALSKRIRQEILAGNSHLFDLRDTTVDHELQYWKAVGPADGDEVMKIDTKFLSYIVPFKGGTDQEWRAFEHPWIQAIKNRKIKEHDLISALNAKLQGQAAQYYMAIPRVEEKSFGEIMQILRERYTNDPMTARAAVITMVQLPKEQVKDYSARMHNASKSMNPSIPKALKCLYVQGDCGFIIPNPKKIEEEAAYSAQLSSVKTMMTTYFLSGLRPEIAVRLPADKYEEYDRLVEASLKAEWMMNATVGGLVNFTQADTTKRHDGDRGDQNKGKDQEDRQKNQPDKKPGTCFTCGKTGHWSRDCYQNKRRNENQGFQNKRFDNLGSRNKGNEGRQNPNRGKFWRPKNFRNKMTGQNKFPAQDRFGRRKWMVQNRARFNQRRGAFKKVYHLYGVQDDEEEISDYTPEELELFDLEEALEDQYPDDVEDYYRDVEKLEEQLSKN